MNSLKIREIFNQSVDFFKLHYEYLLPFSLLYFVLNLPQQFIKSVWMMPVMLIVMPLAFAVPYFVDRITRRQEKKFSLFFEVYNYFFKYFAISILRGIIILILLSPFLYTFMDVIKEYDFDMQKLNEAIQANSIHLSENTIISMVVSFLIVVLCLPFLLLNEYFGILDDYSIIDSFQKAYEAGVRNYFSLFGILILSFVILFAGLCACCIGVIFALPLIYIIYYFTYRAIEPR
jgi:uncharacterized membrane protein